MADEIIDLTPAAPAPRGGEKHLDLGGRRWAGAGPCPGGGALKILFILLAVLVAVVGGVVSTGKGLPQEHRPIGWLVTAAGVGACLVAFATQSRRGEKIEIAVYEKGLVYNDAVETFVVRWPEVTTVTEVRVDLYDEEGKQIGRGHFLRVQTKTEGDHRFEVGAIEDSDRLAGLVHEGTLPFLVPRAAEKLAAGQPLVFGPVTLYAEGVVFKREQLAWAAMSVVDVENGELVIGQKGNRRPWAVVPCAEVPNVQVLLALIKGLNRAPAAAGLEGDPGRPGGSRYSVLDKYQRSAGGPQIGY